MLSPFVALVCAHVLSKRWAALTRTTLYGVMLLLTLSSLASYGYVALGPLRPQPSFVFLVVPLASWLLIAIVLPMAAFISGSRTKR